MDETHAVTAIWFIAAAITIGFYGAMAWVFL